MFFKSFTWVLTLSIALLAAASNSLLVTANILKIVADTPLEGFIAVKAVAGVTAAACIAGGVALLATPKAVKSAPGEVKPANTVQVAVGVPAKTVPVDLCKQADLASNDLVKEVEKCIVILRKLYN
jgi:hypothetical protein